MSDIQQRVQFIRRDSAPVIMSAAQHRAPFFRRDSQYGESLMPTTPDVQPRAPFFRRDSQYGESLMPATPDVQQRSPFFRRDYYGESLMPATPDVQPRAPFMSVTPATPDNIQHRVQFIRRDSNYMELSRPTTPDAPRRAPMLRRDSHQPPFPPSAPSPPPQLSNMLPKPPKRPELPSYKSHLVSESWFDRIRSGRGTYRAMKTRRFILSAVAGASVIALSLLLYWWFVGIWNPIRADRYAVDHRHVSERVDHNNAAEPTAEVRIKKMGLPKTPLQQKKQRKHRAADGANRKAAAQSPSFHFTSPQQELGVLISFLAALTSNALPVSIDPSQPLDPDLVLEFNPREENVEEDVHAIVAQAWKRNPVVIFSDLQRGNPPASREVKAMIEELKLYPDPTIFEVDLRDDEPVLRPLLQRLTATESVPLIIVGGSPIRSLDELRVMHASGRLNETIVAAGAQLNGRRKKHGRKH